MPLKSQYDLIIEEFERNDKVTNYSEQDSLQIIADINGGMEDFLYQQKANEKESEHELRSIVLNA